MEKYELEKILLQKMEYEMAFKNGYSYVLYNDDVESLSEPSVNYGSFQSIGYYDGFQYGDYCVRVGLRFDIKPDNLVAQMDKTFTHALEKNREYVRQQIIDNEFSSKQK